METQNIQNIFLSQSYKDSFNDYLYILEHGSSSKWDWFIITASNRLQADAYEKQLELRRKNGWLPDETKFLVIPDPDGMRVGSGGATLNVLKKIMELSHEPDPFTGKKIAILHSGGDSKRIPQYSATGKLFAHVPRKLPYGRFSTLFDEFLISLSAVPSRMSDGLLVMSGDVLMLYNPLQIDLQREGAACISIKAPVETGTRHGVFLPSDDSYVKAFLHKQSRETLEKSGAVNDQGNIDIDTGSIWMSSSVVKLLTSLFCTEGKISNARFRTFVNSKVCLNFYGDFVYPMASDSTLPDFLIQPSEAPACQELSACRKEIFSLLGSITLKLIRMSPAKFIHFGTTAEFKELMVHAESKYGYLDWGCRGTRAYSSLNSTVAHAEIKAGSYIEDSEILDGAKIGKDCIVSNVSFDGILFDNTVLHLLPVFYAGSSQFVARIYSINDNPKESLESGGTFLGVPFSDLLTSLSLSKSQVFSGTDYSLWNAKLYPVCQDAGQAIAFALFLQNAAHGKLDNKQLQSYLDSERLSLKESFNCAEVDSIIKRQERLEDKICVQKFTQQIISGQSVYKLIDSLGHTNTLIRRAEILYNQALNTKPYDKFRIFCALAQVCRTHKISCGGGSPSELEQLAFETIHDLIGENLIMQKNDSFELVKNLVEIQLPVRVNFGGAWSDTPPYCLEHGGTVLNAAIKLNGEMPVKVIAKRLDQPLIILESIDLHCRRVYNSRKDLNGWNNPSDPFALHKAALESFNLFGSIENDHLKDLLIKAGGGLYLSTDVKVPKGSGLGTSSVIAAALVKAISEITGSSYDDQDIFDKVLQIEQLMTTGGGWQDQVGGVVPGFKLIRSNAGTRQYITVEPVHMTEKTLLDIQNRFVLIYTGQRRLARNLLREIMRRYIVNDSEMIRILNEIQHLALLMKFELEKGNINGFIRLLNEHWELSKKLDPGMTNTCIEHIIKVCRPFISGVMICGAGGGGFLEMILKEGYTKEQLKRQLYAVFQDVGVKVWDTQFYI